MVDPLYVIVSALSGSPLLWRSDVGAEDLIEAGGELGVTVAEEELGLEGAILEFPGQVPSLLSDPLAGGVGGDAAEVDLRLWSSMKKRCPVTSRCVTSSRRSAVVMEQAPRAIAAFHPALREWVTSAGLKVSQLVESVLPLEVHLCGRGPNTSKPVASDQRCSFFNRRPACARVGRTDCS